MASPTTRVIVKGQRELDSAFRSYERKVKYGMAKGLLSAAGVVAADARNLFAHYDARSAAGFRPRVRRGAIVVVEQRRRRTTGKHPSYGALQMRKALLPALMSNEDNVVRAVEFLLDKAAIEGGF